MAAVEAKIQALIVQNTGGAPALGINNIEGGNESGDAAKAPERAGPAAEPGDAQKAATEDEWKDATEEQWLAAMSEQFPALAPALYVLKGKGKGK